MHTKDARDELTHPVQLSPDQREAVVEEMNRILADPAFNGSKRCVVLFKYLVNCALRGEQGEFKERTLGIEVFGRDPSYDCQDDPIVRVTAGEIRKRLGQCYYEEQGTHHRVKIRLARGGYIPEFQFGDSEHSDADTVEVQEQFSVPAILPLPENQQVEITEESLRPALKHTWLIWIGIVILTLAAAGAAFYHYGPSRSRQDLFWGPLASSNQPLIICVADDPSLAGPSGEDRAQNIADAGTSSQTPEMPASPDFIPVTPFVDMTSANQVTSWFVAHGRKVFIQRASTATLHIFRQGPAVLIGTFDNPWSLILLSNLRYSLHADSSTHERWIEDAQNPSKREWKINTGLNFNDSYVDYALIARFWDGETDNWIVGITSLGPHGPRAASELITESAYAKSLPPSINSKSNFQIIVKTSVINGNTSPPQVVAVHTW